MKLFQYHFSDYLWLYLVAVVVWCSLFGIFRLFKRGPAAKNTAYFLLVAIAFSFLGLTIGLHIGLSESPVIGLVIPALLTFIGGFMVYVFVFTDKSKLQDGFVLLIIMISLCFFLMLGSNYASSVRSEYDRQLQDYLYDQKKDFEFFKSQLVKGNVKMESDTTATSGLKSGDLPNESDKKLFEKLNKNK